MCPRPSASSVLHVVSGAALAAAIAVILYPAYAGGQAPSAAQARIEGEIRDSVRARGAAGATVFVTRVRPAPSA